MEAVLLVLVVLQALALAVLGLVLRRYLPSYFAKKGENLATREDIAAITREIEKVRHEYGSSLEALRAAHEVRSKLRLAVAEARLEKLQRAYELWNKLLRGLHTPGSAAIVYECQEWWISNSLYLDGKSRETFRAAYWAAMMIRDSHPGDDVDLRLKLHDVLMAAGPAIVEAAELPSLGADEGARVDSATD